MKSRSGLILLCIVLFFLVVNNGMSQRTLSLEECVAIAYDRSLELQSADLNIEQAGINVRQAHNNRYPTLNGSTQYSWNQGRTIDPTTNVFDNQSSTYQTFRLDAGFNLYQGGVINNTIKQSELSTLSSYKRKEALVDNIGLQVAQNYLNAQLADESIQLAQVQRQLTENQLDRIDKLIVAGSVPANDRLELEAQLIRDEQQLITAENNYDLAILNLKHLLLIDISEDITLEKINPDDIPIDETVLDKSLEEIYREALNYQPSIKADSLDLRIAHLDKKISEGRLYPSISIGASLATNYSSLASQVADQQTIYTDLPVIIGGTEVIVGFPTMDATFEDIPYFDQLDNNLGYGAGIQLQVPIYNNHSARLNVERSEVAIQQTAVQNEINRQNLRSTIQSAVAQAKAAKKTFLAGEKSAIAQRGTLDNLEKKFESGLANNYDFINAKNNLNITENSLLQAKYDFIFKLKVIDYYLGKPLKL